MNEEIKNQENKPYGLIYKITNLINGKIYIGQTTNTKNFINNKYFGSGTLIRLKINEYKKENFKKEIFQYVSNQEELNNLEIFYIKQFNSLVPNGYNLSSGGNQGGICHNETKEKISKIHKDKKLSIETKQKLSLINKNKIVVKDKCGNKFQLNNNDPRYLSGELVGVTKNHTLSILHVNAIRKSNKNKATVKDKDGKVMAVDINNPRYLSGELISIWTGKQHTEQYKSHMSNLMKGRKLSYETKNKIKDKLKGFFLAKDKFGNKYRITKDDTRWINKELVGLRSKL